MTEQQPLVKTHSVRVAAVDTEGNDLTSEVAEAPFAGTITSVKYVPDATQAGANTNSRTYTVVNKTKSVTAATLAQVSGVELTAATAKAIPVSGTAANVEVAEGDEIAFVSTHVGTGIKDPGGLVEVQFSRS
jgi:hypothetical protein